MPESTSIWRVGR